MSSSFSFEKSFSYLTKAYQILFEKSLPYLCEEKKSFV